MFNFDDAFLHIFKERRWWLKIGIMFLVSYCFTVVTTILSTLTTDYSNFNTLNLKTLTSLDYTTSLIVGALTIVLTIIYVLVSGLYTYENTQAGIQKRATRLPWEYSLWDGLKKVLKYVLASLIYAVIIFILLAFIIGLPALFIALLIGTAFSASGASSSSIAGLVAIGSILFCAFIIVALIISVLIYAFTMPGYLRLIASNTFSEAFHFGSNIRIGKEYFGSFLLTVVLTIIFAVLYGAFSSILSGIATSILFFNPIVGIVLYLIFEIPLSLVLTYFTYFVYTRLLGDLYRNIINKEEELKFLRK